MENENMKPSAATTDSAVTTDSVSTSGSSKNVAGPDVFMAPPSKNSPVPMILMAVLAVVGIGFGMYGMFFSGNSKEMSKGCPECKECVEKECPKCAENEVECMAGETTEIDLRNFIINQEKLDAMSEEMEYYGINIRGNSKALSIKDGRFTGIHISKTGNEILDSRLTEEQFNQNHEIRNNDYDIYDADFYHEGNGLNECLVGVTAEGKVVYLCNIEDKIHDGKELLLTEYPNVDNVIRVFSGSSILRGAYTGGGDCIIAQKSDGTLVPLSLSMD